MNWASGCALGLALSLGVGCSSSDTGGGGGNTPPDTEVITSEKFGEAHTGVATFYAATGAGACSYDKTSDVHIAALTVSEWAGSAYCGACADVTGPMGNTIRVKIVDLCPDCGEGQLDLHPGAFTELAPMEQGRIPISWTFVACDAVGAVKYKYKDGANQYWTAVQVRNSRFPITKLESSKDGSTWTDVKRLDYNYFVNESGFGPGTTQVRITAVDGQTLTDTLPAVQAELEVSGAAQFQ